MLINHSRSRIVRPRVANLDDNPASPDEQLERFHQRLAKYRMELRKWQRRLWANGTDDPVCCVIAESRAAQIAQWCGEVCNAIHVDLEAGEVNPFADDEETQRYYSQPFRKCAMLECLARQVEATAQKLFDNLPCE